MATPAEIRQNIDMTRDNITSTVEELSNVVHKRFDIVEKVKENPETSILIALASGFVLASLSKPFGRMLLKIALRTAIGAAGAYASKQGMKIVTNRIKSL